jgi:hypothetical protein
LSSNVSDKFKKIRDKFEKVYEEEGFSWQDFNRSLEIAYNLGFKEGVDLNFLQDKDLRFIYIRVKGDDMQRGEFFKKITINQASKIIAEMEIIKEELLQLIKDTREWEVEIE